MLPPPASAEMPPTPLTDPPLTSIVIGLASVTWVKIPVELVPETVPPVMFTASVPLPYEIRRIPLVEPVIVPAFMLML